jgi:very-short-patch-repair endonuclease
MRKHARALRTNMTLAERIIWRAVRAHRLNGVGFRRQAPIGPYIADFVSHTAMLVIEIDGGQHFEQGHERRDAIRDRYLSHLGFRVLRFNNLDVMRNREGVLTMIAAALGETAAPSLPSPAGGGGGESAAP